MNTSNTCPDPRPQGGCSVLGEPVKVWAPAVYVRNAEWLAAVLGGLVLIDEIETLEMGWSCEDAN